MQLNVGLGLLIMSEPFIEEYDSDTDRQLRHYPSGGVVNRYRGTQRKKDIFDYVNVPYLRKMNQISRDLLGNEWADKADKFKGWVDSVTRPDVVRKASNWFDSKMVPDERRDYNRALGAGDFTPKNALPPGKRSRDAIAPDKKPNLYDYSTVKGGPSNNGTVRKSSSFRKRRMGFRKRRYGRKRRGGSRKRGGSNKTVTFQHDSVSTYRKKRMSRGGRKRMRRNFKRSVSTTLRGMALNTVKRVYNLTFTSTAGAQETAFVPGLYSLYGSSQWDDLQAITAPYQQIQTFVPGNSGTPDVNNSNKFMFSHAGMEMDLCNTGATPCIVELYLCRSRDQGIPRVSPAGDYVVDDFRPTGMTDISAAPTTRQYNSLFDSKQFCSRNEILNVQKIYLNAGASTDKSLNLKRNVYFSSSSLSNTAGVSFNYENRTYFYCLILTGAPVVSGGGSSAQFGAASVSLTTERTYHFKILPGGNSTIAGI